MVPAEVLAELQPFVSLSQGLGTAAVQLVRDTGFTDIKITYHSPRSALNLIGNRVDDAHFDALALPFSCCSKTYARTLLLPLSCGLIASEDAIKPWSPSIAHKGLLCDNLHVQMGGLSLTLVMQ